MFIVVDTKERETSYDSVDEAFIKGGVPHRTHLDVRQLPEVRIRNTFGNYRVLRPVAERPKGRR